MANSIASQFKDWEEKKSSESLFICKEQMETEAEERTWVLIELTFFEGEKISESANIAASENRVDITRSVCCLMENVPLKSWRQYQKLRDCLQCCYRLEQPKPSNSSKAVNSNYLESDAVDCSSLHDFLNWGQILFLTPHSIHSLSEQQQLCLRV